MGKPVYVTLDTRMAEEPPLSRSVDMKYVEERDFADLLDKLADPTADEYHSGYNAQEKEVADYLEDCINFVNNYNQNSLQLTYIPKGNGEEKIVNLYDKISDYTQDILHVDSVIGDSGEEQKFYEMKLCLESSDPGGTYNLEKMLDKPMYKIDLTKK
ncbi:MAG: hypothetical protein ACQESF_02515 [Nanobdellota archaeon]